MSRGSCRPTGAAIAAFAAGLALAVTPAAVSRIGQQEAAPSGYDDTPLLPDGRWRVHDGTRPRPLAVAPGECSTAERAGRPPSDAMVLFDGTSVSAWRTADGSPATWKVQDGFVEVTPPQGDILTRQQFGDVQLHVEWSSPALVRGHSQGRGNSGIFLMDRYEVQVLDSHENPTYADGQAGAIYGQFPPLVNASRGPGQWQTYDIVFTAPRFRDGQLDAPAFLTVLHNGVLIQNHRALLGATKHRQLGAYTAHGPAGPLRLQDHGDPVRYRNIWVRPLGGTAD